MIIVEFFKRNEVVATRIVDVFYNEYGKNHVEHMLQTGLLSKPDNYDFYSLSKGQS